jgi:hypothetical protein
VYSKTASQNKNKNLPAIENYARHHNTRPTYWEAIWGEPVTTSRSHFAHLVYSFVLKRPPTPSLSSPPPTHRCCTRSSMASTCPKPPQSGLDGVFNQWLVLEDTTSPKHLSTHEISRPIVGRDNLAVRKFQNVGGKRPKPLFWWKRLETSMSSLPNNGWEDRGIFGQLGTLARHSDWNSVHVILALYA